MKATLFDYRDYKKLLVDLIESDDSKARGKRKLLAESVGCQVSHVTNVLSGAGHFSQEQAEAAARFFGLTPSETEFLLMLVQFNRAGTTQLRRFYEKLLTERQEKFSALKTRLEMPDSLRAAEEAEYYSSWHYGAVHVLLSIPDSGTREAISEKLKIPLARVDEILNFLVSTGLAEKRAHRFQIGRTQIHLDKNSPLISKHHTNWRLRSMQSLDDTSSQDLHYSSVFTVSKKDYPKVREILASALSEALKVVTASPEEQVASICLDAYLL